MAACRVAAAQQVREDFEAGRLDDFATSVRGLIQPFDEEAIFDEGAVEK